jgi:hypothetical protein
MEILRHSDVEPTAAHINEVCGEKVSTLRGLR